MTKSRQKVQRQGQQSTRARKGGLSQDEIQAQGGNKLPDREAMSLINANIAIPINAAIAANVLSDGSTAIAGALQDTPIDQST